MRIRSRLLLASRKPESYKLVMKELGINQKKVWSSSQLIRDLNWIFTSPALVDSNPLRLEDTILDRS